eukprot:m.111004 g.111004  ORF g.111004 m.111004 type:complete len:74 (+) comp12909_c0_seq3:3606-3827(+)
MNDPQQSPCTMRANQQRLPRVNRTPLSTSHVLFEAESVWLQFLQGSPLPHCITSVKMSDDFADMLTIRKGYHP